MDPPLDSSPVFDGGFDFGQFGEVFAGQKEVSFLILLPLILIKIDCFGEQILEPCNDPRAQDFSHLGCLDQLRCGVCFLVFASLPEKRERDRSLLEEDKGNLSAGRTRCNKAVGGLFEIRIASYVS